MATEKTAVASPAKVQPGEDLRRALRAVSEIADESRTDILARLDQTDAEDLEALTNGLADEDVRQRLTADASDVAMFDVLAVLARETLKVRAEAARRTQPTATATAGV